MAKGKLDVPVERACPGCGCNFTTDAPNQRFHNERCRWSSAARVRTVRNSNKTERHCGRCQQTKPASEFGAHHSYCRLCYNAWQRERTASLSTEDKKARRRRSYDAEVARDPQFFRKMTLKKFGLSVEGFDAMLARQGGRCALCPRTEPGGRGTWHVDHDHECCPGAKSCGGCIRGLLCSSHNTGMGQFKDDPVALRAAADYIEMHRRARLARPAA